MDFVSDPFGHNAAEAEKRLFQTDPVVTPDHHLEATPLEAPFARGPMRPDALALTRRRLAGKSLTTRFRVADILALSLLTPVCIATGSTVSVLSLPLRTALPQVIGAALTLWALRALKAYSLTAREALGLHCLRVAAASVVGAGGAVALAALFHAGLELSALWSLASAASLLVIHGVDWALVGRWRRAGRLTPNVVVVGATSNARRLIEAALVARDVAVLGVFDDRMSRVPQDLHGVPLLGDTKALLTHKLLPFIDHIIITVTPTAQKRVGEIIDRLKFLPNTVTLFMDVEGVEAQRKTLRRLNEAPLTQVSGGGGDAAKSGPKRLQDLILASAGLLLATPLMALIALAIRLEGRGPVFFRQRRYGFNNEPIDVWKFRSMRPDAADPTAERQIGPCDDRVTKVGRIIRRLSLDELPQLINIVKGEMSLVGPRPHAIGMKTAGEDSARLVAEYAWRHRMKPGLTGWAQINGSIGAVNTPDQVRRRVALDVEYIERHTLWFDLYILLMTVPALIGARNVVR